MNECSLVDKCRSIIRHVFQQMSRSLATEEKEIDRSSDLHFFFLPSKLYL